MCFVFICKSVWTLLYAAWVSVCGCSQSYCSWSAVCRRRQSPYSNAFHHPSAQWRSWYQAFYWTNQWKVCDTFVRRAFQTVLLHNILHMWGVVPQTRASAALKRVSGDRQMMSSTHFNTCGISFSISATFIETFLVPFMFRVHCRPCEPVLYRWWYICCVTCEVVWTVYRSGDVCEYSHRYRTAHTNNEASAETFSLSSTANYFQQSSIKKNCLLITWKFSADFLCFIPIKNCSVLVLCL